MGALQFPNAIQQKPNNKVHEIGIESNETCTARARRNSTRTPIRKDRHHDHRSWRAVVGMPVHLFELPILVATEIPPPFQFGPELAQCQQSGGAPCRIESAPLCLHPPTVIRDLAANPVADISHELCLNTRSLSVVPVRIVVEWNAQKRAC